MLTSGTVLITGGSVGGLGFETAVHLARLAPTRIVLTLRSDAAADAVIRELRKRVPEYKGAVDVLVVDFADFASVRACGERVRAMERLDAAVLNAGVAPSRWRMTDDGWEETWVPGLRSVGQ